ncbi:MAG: glycosyltransferase, partial [Miltoncostaeaceae bacterium]
MASTSGSSPSRRRGRAKGRRFTALRLPIAPLWRTERRVHALALAALIAGIAYLGWRVAFTLVGAPPGLAIALVVVEAWAIGQLALLAYQVWRVPGPEPRAPVPSPDSPEVLVRMLDGDRDALERTLVGCARLAGTPPITVLGDPVDAHEELEGLARRHGARYVRGADSGLREALRAASGELVLLLAAGEVPEPTILREASGRMLDPQVAAVQCAVEYANPHALTHVLAGRSEQEFVTNVLGPGLGARGMAPSSPSAVVVRRSVYAAAAPKASRSLHEEALVTEAAVLAQGRSIVFQRSPVVRTLGPESVRDYVAAARARAAAALRFLVSRRGPLLSRSMPTRVGLALAARASRYLSGVHRLALVGIVLATILGGRLPFGTGVWEFAAVVGPVYFMLTVAWLALGRGDLDPGDRTRHALRTMGAHCRGALAALAPARLADALLRPRGSASGSLRQL